MSILENTPKAVMGALKKKNAKMFAAGFGGLVLVAGVLAVGISVYRVYNKAAQDSFSVGVARALGLSAMKVNGVTISYADYAQDMEAIRRMRDFEQKSGTVSQPLSDQDLSDQVILRIVNNIVVAQRAKELGITVEDKDIEAIKTDLTTRYQTLENAEKELVSRYGWSLPVYEERVIRPLILQKKLEETIYNDATKRAEIRSQAQKVLEEIKKGGDFAALAKQYGQDGTAPNGGDLGDFKKGDMVAAFEQAVMKLKKGQLAPELVETQFGYHIVQLTDKRVENVKNEETGKTEPTDIFRARHILFSFPTINTYLNDAIQNVNVEYYINVHDPIAFLKSQMVQQ